MLPQYLTEGVLRDRLAELGHAPRFGHELTGFEQDGEGVTAGLAKTDGTTATVRARYLVGADGGRSFVRKALAIDFPGESMKMRAMVADLSLIGLGRDAWHRWGEGPRQISLCPLMGTDLFQLQMPVPLDGDVDTSVAAGVLGLSSKLLEAARTRGDLRRGRDTQQLGLGYRTSPLAHDARGDDAVVRAGDRAPDAPCRVVVRRDSLYVYLHCWVAARGPCCATGRPVPAQSDRARA